MKLTTATKDFIDTKADAAEVDGELEGKTNVADMQNHCQTDLTRWSTNSNFQNEAIDSIVNIRGMKKDTDNVVDITEYQTFANQYTVTSPYGGLLLAGVVTTDTEYTSVYVNGGLKYSSKGLVTGGSLITYFHVDKGDTIYVQNPLATSFTPYIADPGSQMQQLLATNSYQSTQISALQASLADLEASVQNKTIANQTPIDITNTSYTVTNSLGVRATGQGNSVLGLLGITVASTGTCTFTPLPPGVQNYDNTALLSGTPAIFSVNLPQNTVIDSSNMKYVTVYEYIAGT